MHRIVPVAVVLMSTLILGSSGCPVVFLPDGGDGDGDEYTLTVNITGSGTVDLDPAGGTYAFGTSVEPAANADEGWQFDHWEGDLTGSTNPDTIVMDEDKTVTAVFVEEASGALALFDEVWEKFDEYYSYFIYKGIDWDQIKTDYRANFDADLSADQFVDKLVEVLAELHDWHVEVQKADGTWVGTNPRTYTENYPHTPRNMYLAAGASYESMGDNVVRHAWFQNNIAYIRIDDFATSEYETISDEDINDLFTTYAGADGMILDLRPNSGGNAIIAEKFTSHFTDAEQIYGFTETRDGPDHDDFDPLEVKTLTPSTGQLFLKPTACLVGAKCLSATEWAALMMRVCANVTLIGDTTRGGSGFPAEFELSNGVNYKVSRWIAYTELGDEFEDVGIEPDIKIDTDNSFDGSHDYVLERAIEELTS
ncbi:MAG: S41 family peptidase [Phycisphaerae bacterium]|nr:S41 family peptidase [Phycisphaerae bacterium]